MTAILALRHAPTAWNAAGLIQGRTDVPLGETGRQHYATLKLPAEWRRAKCLSSPLARALETARLLGLEPTVEPRLIEMDWGAWEGQSLKDLRVALGSAMAENEERGLDFRPPGGESPRDVEARLRDFLPSLREPTVLVTHKGVLRAMLALATSWTMREKPAVRMLDACAHEFEASADGRIAVSRLNIALERR